MLMSLLRSDTESANLNQPSLREIVTVTVMNRAGIYWHADGTIEATIAAAEAVQDQGIEAIIDTIEREVKKREFICNFDDPCDKWAA
jgi:hypothetical protein